MVLTKREIEEALQATPPLIEGLADPAEQLQPNGVDITVGEVALLSGTGQLGVSNSQRRLPQTTPLTFDGLGYVELPPGLYMVTYNEAVHLPPDMMALGFPRSSLVRCGATLLTAVWDAGYSGRSQSTLVVYNPAGLRLQRGARVLQLVFLRLSGETEGYRGRFQGENL
ncbi:MAG: deoxyuridine 5'-triphosphate nucleotidohydrolase [Dehalococcoidia bacterium]